MGSGDVGVETVALMRGPSSHLEMLRDILDDAGIPASVQLDGGRFFDPKAPAAGGASLHVPTGRADEARAVLDEAHSGPPPGQISEEAQRPSGRWGRPEGSGRIEKASGAGADGASAETLELEGFARRVYYLGILAIVFSYLFIAPFALFAYVVLQRRIGDAEGRQVPVTASTRHYGRAAFVMSLIGVAILPLLIGLIVVYGVPSGTHG